MRRDTLEREYYFDIVRTKHEVYSHAWQVLHQVEGEKESGGGREGEKEEGESDDATVTMWEFICSKVFYLFENSFALHTAYIQYVWALS